MAIDTTNIKANVIDLATSLTTANKLNLSERLYESIYQASDFATSRKIVPGVRNGSLVPVFDETENYNSFPQQDGCDDNECDLDITTSTHRWLIGNYNCKIPICLKDFEDDFLLFFNTWKTDNGDEGINTALVQYLADKFKKQANAALWTKSFVAEDGSGNAVLEQSNGHLVLAEAGGGIKKTLTENATGTESLTFADENAVYDYLNAMYDDYVASEWFSEDVVFEMNKLSALNYLKWLDVNGNKTSGCCVDVDKIMGGQKNLSGLAFKGIPIVVRPEYDKISAQVLAGAKPHYILLTNKNNLVIGTEQLGKLNDFNIWYSVDANKIFMRGELNLGAALPTNNYILTY